jgi:hypothetical protein
MTPQTPQAALAEALGTVIESRMSRDLAWTQDDGKTVIRLNPEEAGWHLGHLAHGRLAAAGFVIVNRDAHAAAVTYIGETQPWLLRRAEGAPNEGKVLSDVILDTVAAIAAPAAEPEGEGT